MTDADGKSPLINACEVSSIRWSIAMMSSHLRLLVATEWAHCLRASPASKWRSGLHTVASSALTLALCRPTDMTMRGTLPS